MEGYDVENSLENDIFNKRPQRCNIKHYFYLYNKSPFHFNLQRSFRFSFGLGKRSSPVSALKDKRLHELLAKINKWGFSGNYKYFSIKQI